MTGDLRPYPEYKDTGLPWLGRVPAHWDVIRTKGLFRLSIEKSAAQHGMELLSIYTHIGVRPRKDLEERGNKASTTDGYWIVRKGDLIVNKLLAWMGAVGVSHYEGVTSPAYDILRPRRALNSDYYHYLFRTGTYLQQFKSRSRGIMDMRLRLYFDQLGQIPSLVPPHDEQNAIVAFLDDAFRKTNKFIRNRRRLIEVLNEQKQAIINRAVTRGLDPNAPLKPSGIDWLGDIPRHWEVKRLKFVAKIIYGSSPHNSTYNTDGIGTVLVNGPDEYSREDFGLTRSVKWTTAPVKFAPKGALLFCLRGSTTGRLNICHTDLSIGRGVAALIPRENQHYFSYAMMALRGHLKATFRGSTFPSVTSNHLNNYWLPQPPIIEQEYIAKYIDEATMALNQAIDRANREIDLIREYRTRLIADVVTGKVDVRQASVVVAEKKTKKPANIHFRRSVFAAEIVHRLHDEPTFGHVKFEKLIFLCEKRCGVETGSTYYRQAAGPYDNRALRSIDSQLKTQRWYEAHRGDKGYRYIRLEKAGEHKKYFDRYFGSVISRFDEIIDLFRHARTEQCEIIATLYAAWEDLLTQGSATDEQIIEQVLHHWHPSKQKISEDRWRKALAWMKEKGLTPRTEATCADN